MTRPWCLTCGKLAKRRGADMKHTVFPEFYDTRGSQAFMARHHLKTAEKGMADCARIAFDPSEPLPEWRQSHRRMFAGHRKDHDRAKAVLQYLGEMQ